MDGPTGVDPTQPHLGLECFCKASARILMACGSGLHTGMIAPAVGSGVECLLLSTVRCEFLNFHARCPTSQVCVVSGKLEEMGVFGQYGGLVFELFYRADLSQFG